MFTDSMGKKVRVKSFGIREKDEYAHDRLRRQVKVLYIPKDQYWSGKEVSELVVDPCKDSRPYQLILAVIERKATLARAVAEVKEKMAQGDDRLSRCGPRDSLLIPAMHWRIHHHFRELEGKDRQFRNSALAGRYLDTALQTIQFRLDRAGAELSSEAKLYVKPGASHFHLNRPFLVLVRKRDAEHPFFVMWVDNAELLDR